MLTIIILTVSFTIMGVLFAFGKGAFLIAGYNTATDAEKAKYDEKRLCRCYSIFCLAMAAVIGITGWVDTEEFALFTLPLILLLVVFILIVTGTYCKKKK